jgi:hypothetical protein
MHRLITAVPVCLPLGRCLSGSCLVGLTRRTQLFEHLLTHPAWRSATSDAPVPAAAHGGFLSDIFECNDGIRQQVSFLSSRDFHADLKYVELTATAPAAGGDIDRLPSTQLFKDAVRDRAIEMSGAMKKEHLVYVKWRSEGAAADGVSRVTIFNIGFSPETLHVEFLRRAKILQETAVGGFRIHQSGITVFNAPSARGFRFYVPIPPGWTDELLCEALIMQGGLDPDHLLCFGTDYTKNLKVSAPSGDVFFNIAPAGCINHGSEELIPILQPPNRFFVTHPVTGAENHLQVRKAGACKHCWATPGRHQNACVYKGYCRMCLELYADMPAGGKRHACGQGHLSKAQGKSTVDPGAVPSEAPTPSPLAAKLRAMQEANIAAAKAKRKREEDKEASPPEDDPTPAQANKAPRSSGRDSPSAPPSPSPAEAAPATVSKAVARRDKNRKQ